MIVKELVIKPTPEQLADEFWSLTSREQARFFDRLGEKDGVRMAYQLEYLRQERLTKAARHLMVLLGRYAVER